MQPTIYLVYKNSLVVFLSKRVLFKVIKISFYTVRFLWLREGVGAADFCAGGGEGGIYSTPKGANCRGGGGAAAQARVSSTLPLLPPLSSRERKVDMNIQMTAQ